MERLRLALCCCLCALVVAPVAPAAAATPANVQMVQLVNKARVARGIPAMRVSPSLMRSATAFSYWQMRNQRYGHTSTIRMSSRFRLRGECIALRWGHRVDVRNVLRAWLRSSGHRRIVLGRSFRAVGAGVRVGWYRSRRAHIWTLQVGR